MNEPIKNEATTLSPLAVKGTQRTGNKIFDVACISRNRIWCSLWNYADAKSGHDAENFGGGSDGL